jgi:hypothetical protein
MTITLIMSAIAVEHSSAAAQGSQLDTSQWKSRKSAQWGFNISVPSDWNQLNMPPVGNNKMSLKRKLENNKSVSCSISATDDTQTAGLSQQEINERMPSVLPSIQEAQAMTPTGSQRQVLKTSLAQVSGVPVFVYDLSGLIPQMDVENVNREIMVTLFTPGRTFNFSCGVWASSVKEVNELYAQWLPTLRGIFSTVIVDGVRRWRCLPAARLPY